MACQHTMKLDQQCIPCVCTIVDKNVGIFQCALGLYVTFFHANLRAFKIKGTL